LTLDAAGQLYISNYDGQAVNIHGAGANGNDVPIGHISGANTMLNNPVGIAVDAAGHVFVASHGGSTITRYAAGATGDLTPDVILGAASHVYNPWGIVIH
jgi:6-phosphogluconolactonase (cycloisomerase 2 family)